MSQRPTGNSPADPGDTGGSGSRLTTRELAINLARTAAAVGALVAIALLAPGLGEVRQLLERAAPAWIALAVAFEAASFGSYIVMFAPVFGERIGWRRSWEIGGSELAVGAIIPTSGIAALAFGAWPLSTGGMDAETIARRSVAFYLLKSSVNWVAVAVVGIAAFCGLGPELSPWLTIFPAILAIALIAAVLAIPRFGGGEGPRPGDRRLRRLGASARKALVTGTEESKRVLAQRDPRVIGGSIGYWLFDNAVLWATFAAIGVEPALTVILLGYLIGQLGGLLPIPGGVGGIDGGLIGTLIVYGVPAAAVAAAVLAYRVILFWVPLVLGAAAFFALQRRMPTAGEFSR